MKLSYKELTIDGGSFDGAFEFLNGDYKVVVKSFQANFLPTDAGLYLDLRFDFEYEAPCDRCLEITKGYGSEKSGISLMQQREGSFNEEIELADDDMGTMYVEEGEIDLHMVVEQEIEFYLPIRMTCGDDCLGLCQQCGGNLNVGKCECEAVVDPRWTALKNIKKN
ncbi:MAG: hypothetical protein C0603_07635 [Denitrovibrio sp.]|nr:MAG: hypothetical protein C0603_07635 [Denitrovibrio sp.]